jgi:SAM-dependent methyltransferase
MEKLSDEQWLAANLDPKQEHPKLDFRIPDLPSDEVQVRFTGACGLANLQQAFDFYRFVLGQLPATDGGRYRVLDFGGGWGRITRFFLREYPADRLALVDCLTDAVATARSLDPPFQVFHTDVQPPLPFEPGSVDCCIAFSVFSHLSEGALEGWLRHLGELLVPGGRVIFTTRGAAQIDWIRRLRRRAPLNALRTLLGGNRNLHDDNLVRLLPHPDEIERRYRKGELQFYPTGGGGELTDNFYGETWIPEAWLRERHASLGFSSCQFFSEFATVNQCVFVLEK